MSGERSSKFKVPSPTSAERSDTHEAQSGGAGVQSSKFKVQSLVSGAAGRVDAADCSRHGAGRKAAEGRSRRGEVRRVWFGAQSRLSAVPSSWVKVQSLGIPGLGGLVGRGSCRAETALGLGLRRSVALPDSMAREKARRGAVASERESTSSLHCAQRDG